MITTLDVLTKDCDFVGEVSPKIQQITVGIWHDQIVLCHTNGPGLDLERGDIRIEIDKLEAIEMCKAILFAFNNQAGF